MRLARVLFGITTAGAGAACSLDVTGTGVTSAVDGGTETDATMIMTADSSATDDATTNDAPGDDATDVDASEDANGERDGSPVDGSDASDAGLDADASDSSYYGNCEAGGACNFALSFAGNANDFVKAAHVPVADNFTLEAFVKATTLASSSDVYKGNGVFFADVSGKKNDFFATVYNSGIFALNVGSTSGDSTTNAASSISTGTWVHLTAVRSEADGGAVDLYINGVHSSSSTGNNAGQLNDPSEFAVGEGPNSDNFNGLIDDVRVWNVARSAAQIAQDATSVTLSSFDPSLVLFWRFDEGTGTTANDSSNGAGNAGSLNSGGVTWVPANR